MMYVERKTWEVQMTGTAIGRLKTHKKDSK
jgi:hypothetical protein